MVDKFDQGAGGTTCWAKGKLSGVQVLTIVKPEFFLLV